LQISQHQGSLKHENFAVSFYHSYATLLPQNILQLHFSCTLYTTASTARGLQILVLIQSEWWVTTTCSQF